MMMSAEELDNMIEDMSLSKSFKLSQCLVCFHEWKKHLMVELHKEHDRIHRERREARQNERTQKQNGQADKSRTSTTASAAISSVLAEAMKEDSEREAQRAMSNYYIDSIGTTEESSATSSKTSSNYLFDNNVVAMRRIDRDTGIVLFPHTITIPKSMAETATTGGVSLQKSLTVSAATALTGGAMTTTAAIIGWGAVDVAALVSADVAAVTALGAVGLISAGVIGVGLTGYGTYRATKAVSTYIDYHTVRTGLIGLASNLVHGNVVAFHSKEQNRFLRLLNRKNNPVGASPKQDRHKLPLSWANEQFLVIRLDQKRTGWNQSGSIIMDDHSSNSSRYNRYNGGQSNRFAFYNVANNRLLTMSKKEPKPTRLARQKDSGAKTRSSTPQRVTPASTDTSLLGSVVHDRNGTGAARAIPGTGLDESNSFQIDFMESPTSLMNSPSVTDGVFMKQIPPEAIWIIEPAANSLSLQSPGPANLTAVAILNEHWQRYAIMNSSGNIECWSRSEINQSQNHLFDIVLLMDELVISDE
jgi:hypothetical protein